MKKILIILVMAFTVTAYAIPDGAVTGTYELREHIATVINVNGFLCAEVKWFSALKNPDLYEVTCVLYRGGNGIGRYIYNAETEVVFKE